MVKVIRGRRYDTNSARLVGSHKDEDLHCKQTGEYFLRIGDKIKPLTYDNAKKWTEEYLPELFHEEFCRTDEEGAVLTSVRLPATLHTRLKREALRRGISLRMLIIEILTLYKTGDPR